MKVTCPQCGDFDLTPEDVEIPLAGPGAPCSYRFVCPNCRAIIVKPGEPSALEILATVGARAVPWEIPAEVHEMRGGPALTEDDLLDLLLELESPDWLDRVRRVGSTT